jgi:hypothetical protein
LAVAQPAGKRVVFRHHWVGAGGGLGESDLDSRAVELDLFVEGFGIDGVGASGDCLAHQLLHGHERVGGLAAPTPVRIRWPGIDDALELRSACAQQSWCSTLR